MRKQKLFGAKWFPMILVLVLVSVLAAGTGYGQTIHDQGRLKTLTRDHPRFFAAAEAHMRHAHRLLDTFGVVGVGIGADHEGEPVIKVFTSQSGIPGIPKFLEGIAVSTKVTGRFYALQSTTERWPRPVPIGVSTGHPDITAGTIGARVKDLANVYALSNNHVYAAVNTARIGDSVLQPGAYDGGKDPDDKIGTLYRYRPIVMCDWFWLWYTCPTTNTIDAAIALSSRDLLGNSTPDSSYTPSAETQEPYVGQEVKKFGRTTGLTTGTVDTINLTVDVCYDDTCSDIARFGDQISITSGGFSAGGDSGSLIVTQEGNHPVGLLFAGSDTNTLANRISTVLTTLGVIIDSEPDAALESISVGPAQASIEVGLTQQFTATGHYDVGPDRDITSTVAWVSSNTSAATINEAGLATGIVIGYTEITATVDGLESNAAQLTVSASTFDSISVTPDNATIEQGETLQFKAEGKYISGVTVDITSTVTWSTSDSSVVTIDPTTGMATGVSIGTVSVTAQLAEGKSGSTSLTVEKAGLHLKFGKTWATSEGLTNVTLDYDYGDQMVVICTVNYSRSSIPMPVVPHVLNASGKSFDIILVRAVGWDFEVCEAEVHWVVVKQGKYTAAEHGIKMEAGKFESTRTDRTRSWVAERIYPAQTYTKPVVLGQVMSLNSWDPEWEFDLWSVFWARGSSSTNPPGSANIWIGKHCGEDPRVRATETLGYVIIETGSGSIGDLTYKAGVTGDIIRGVGDTPPYKVSLSGISSPSGAVAILSSAAMDGGDGGWPILYGTNPITSSGLNLAIDEDWAMRYERTHTTEQAGYLVLE